jgi:hypothetical protein
MRQILLRPLFKTWFLKLDKLGSFSSGRNLSRNLIFSKWCHIFRYTTGLYLWWNVIGRTMDFTYSRLLHTYILTCVFYVSSLIRTYVKIIHISIHSEVLHARLDAYIDSRNFCRDRDGICNYIGPGYVCGWNCFGVVRSFSVKNCYFYNIYLT